MSTVTSTAPPKINPVLFIRLPACLPVCLKGYHHRSIAEFKKKES